MQNQAVAGSAEQSTAKKNLRAQRGRLAIGFTATSTLEFSKQIEQKQDAAEGCFGGEELLHTKIIGAQIVLQFGDAIFHVCSMVVVSP